MARAAAEIEADIVKAKAAGEPPMGARIRALRTELKALDAPAVEHSEPPQALPASSDISFVNDALAQLLLKGKGLAGRAEQNYSDIRSLLEAKHLIEDIAGLVPANRLVLPPWDKLGREKDTGKPFDANTLAIAKATGIPAQQVVEGHAQRALPVPRNRAPVADDDSAKQTITTPDGRPLNFKRSRVLDEPEGAASFVTAEAGEQD